MKRFPYIILAGILLVGCKPKIGRTQEPSSAAVAPPAETTSVQMPKDTPAAPPSASDVGGIDIGATIGFIDLRIDEPNDVDTLKLVNADTTMWLSFPADYYKITDWREDFVPWAFEPYYGIIVMRCVGQTQEFYRVITDENSGRTHLLQKSEATHFQSWEHHLKSVVVISDKMYSQPDIASEATSTEGMDLAVYKVDGDWIKVEVCYNTQMQGWVHWRQNGHLLVEFNYMLE